MVSMSLLMGSLNDLYHVLIEDTVLYYTAGKPMSLYVCFLMISGVAQNQANK